jgi:DNA-binding transcriptional regulator YhcF (GntR family)
MCDDRRYHVLRSGCEVPYIPSELSEPMSRLILVGLADHTNTKGLVYVSARTLAAELDISPNTVFIGYRLFEREGILQRTGKRVGPGGTIEYQMVVEHLAPKNSRFIPLSESMNSSAKAIRQRSTQCTESKHLTDEPTDRSSDLGTITDTDTPSDTPSDAAIRERSRSGGRSRSENLNSNQNNGSRAADVEVLFDDALNLELEYRPSEIPREALKAKKRSSYSRAAEKVLDTYPRARPSIQSDRDLALAVCEIMNPGDYRFQIGATTRQVMNERYKSDPVEYLARRFAFTNSTEVDF